MTCKVLGCIVMGYTMQCMMLLIAIWPVDVACGRSEERRVGKECRN